MSSQPVGTSPTTAYALGGAGLVLLALQIWVISQWAAAASASGSQAESVQYFLTHLPFGLGRLGTASVTWLSAGIGLVGLVAAAAAARRLRGGGRGLCIALAVANGVLVLWYLFTML